MINADNLQNALILIKHHVLDAQKNALHLQGDKDILDSSLKDILEVVDQLTATLPKKMEPAVQDLHETFKKNIKNILNKKPL